MLFAVLVASLVAILIGSLAYLVQALLAARSSTASASDGLQSLLLSRGSLTPQEAALALSLPIDEADRRLRRLVDDERVRMHVDLLDGALRFSAITPASAAAQALIPPARAAFAAPGTAGSGATAK